MAKQEIEDAPYTFIYDTVVVDGKKVKVYSLGGYGKRKLEDAIDKDTVYRMTDDLRAKVSVLLDVIGRDKLFQHLKETMLKRLKENAYRRAELVDDPFMWEKGRALDELFKEGKLVRSRHGGWIKLKRYTPKLKES